MAKTVVAAFLAITAVVALIGNTLVVMLFVKNRQWLKKAHTCLLLALAIQDILTAIGLLVLPGFVQSLDVYDPPSSPALSQLFCSLIWSRYIPFALAISSVYTCLMLTVDRLFATLKPMSYRRFSNSNKITAMLVIVPWFAGFGLEVTAVINVHVSSINDTNVCTWDIDTSRARKSITALATYCGMILVPAIFMTVGYMKIVFTLKKSSSRVRPAVGEPNQIHPKTDSSHLHMKRLTRTAIAASALVIICWLPDHTYYCLFQMDVVAFGTPLHDALVIIAFLNASLNPFLYSFSNKQYRDGFKAILCRKFLKTKSRPTSELNLEERSMEDTAN